MEKMDENHEFWVIFCELLRFLFERFENYVYLCA
jgi:hypothetical protein